MSGYTKTHLSIRQWSEEDRPREKLISKGRAALSDAELIAILIGFGTREMSAVELSRYLLSKTNNDLNELAKWSVGDYKKIKGIGEAKALSVISALELGRRRKSATILEGEMIRSSMETYECMKPHLLDLPHEEFWVIYLNRAGRIIKKESISSGGLAGTVADTRLIFKAALENLATSIILVHNHPSGNCSPSEADISITKKIKEAGMFMEITVLDHVIFTNSGYYSFADEGRYF